MNAAKRKAISVRHTVARLSTVTQLLTIVAMWACTLVMAVAYSDDQAGAERGSVLRLNLNIEKLAEEWMDRQGIKNPAERELLKLVSTGHLSDRIAAATENCSSHITIVNLAHPKVEDWPDRMIEIRPADEDSDSSKLFAYRSTSNRGMESAFASVTVICIEDRDQPTVVFQSHLRYRQSGWASSGDQESKGEK